ncbi:MAG: hypothetical protein H6767_01680 [Candidatus Peribacteria bacterium]|nr:MAG: hypothetical protein H6767_01680 [Candidatus Peribacteria bacterium]
MNSNELIALKRKESEKVKEQYGFPKKNKAIGLIHIEDTALLKGVLEGLEVLPVNFFVLSSEKLSKLPKNVEVLSTLDIKGEAIDFVVCDDCEGNLPDLLKK